MTAALASHPERMSGYGSSLDMDPVHTPARYIALLSIHYQVLRCFTDTILLFETHVSFPLFCYARRQVLGAPRTF